ALDLLEGSGDADAPLGPVREELARVCEQLGQLDRAAGLFAGALDWFQKKGMTGGWMDSGALWLLDLTRGYARRPVSASWLSSLGVWCCPAFWPSKDAPGHVPSWLLPETR